MDTNKLKELAERATATRPDWYTEDGNNWFLPRDCMNWIAAANPQAILELIERLEKAEKDAARYRELRKITPYRFKKIQEAATTDGGDVFYFHADRFDAALDAALEGGGR